MIHTSLGEFGRHYYFLDTISRNVTIAIVLELSGQAQTFLCKSIKVPKRSFLLYGCFTVKNKYDKQPDTALAVLY